jgi:mono/diheme cytochrome c family protein
VPLTEAPDSWKPAVAKAEAAMNGLQSALLARLKDELGKGGAKGALGVCHDEASAIAERVAREQGVSLGRTSHALRNPANAAPAWAAPTVASSSARKLSTAGLRVFDLGSGRVGVLRPIGFAEPCAACHGARDTMAADVRNALASLYPQDRAVGFAPGDLRGWMWAEVKLAQP